MKKNKEPKNIYSKHGLVISIVTILLGGYLVKKHICYLDIVDLIYGLLGIIYVACGILGLVGVFHNEKNIPIGEYYCYPGNKSIFSRYANYVLCFLAYAFLSPLIIYSTGELAAVILISIITAFNIAISMYGVFFYNTYCLVMLSEEICVISFKGIRNVKISDIHYLTPCVRVGGLRAVDKCAETVFICGDEWENIMKFNSAVDKKGVRICFNRKGL